MAWEGFYIFLCHDRKNLERSFVLELGEHYGTTGTAILAHMSDAIPVSNQQCQSTARIEQGSEF